MADYATEDSVKAVSRRAGMTGNARVIKGKSRLGQSRTLCSVLRRRGGGFTKMATATRSRLHLQMSAVAPQFAAQCLGSRGALRGVGVPVNQQFRPNSRPTSTL